MSPTGHSEMDDIMGFPRVSGDEPVTPLSATACPSFSPRERG